MSLLPTCPSCGQSVLDDDVDDCPFCGKPMKGGAGSGGSKSAKKPSTSGQKASGSRRPLKAEPDAGSDDPFDIRSTADLEKAIQARPKPSKGRLHRVICPMCDAQGFVAKSAVGKRVRCANTECLVPVFTATASGRPEEKAAAPTRRADDQGKSEDESSTQAATPGSPWKLYALVGVVAVAAIAGLLAFLNQDAPTELAAGPTPNFDFGPEDEDSDNNAGAADTDSDPEEQIVTPEQIVDELLPGMVAIARTPSQNRDKSWCRRLTGDLYLRLGRDGEANEEFQQIRRVESPRPYYRIEPRLAQFWEARRAGSDETTALLTAALEDRNGIPQAGRLGLESAISVAAALIVSGQADEARQMIDAFERDRSVSANLDQMRAASWFSTTRLTRDQKIAAFPVADVFLWNRSLSCAVAVRLAAEGAPGEAIAWAKSEPEERDAVDALAAVAATLVRNGRTEGNAAALEEAIANRSAAAKLRVQAALLAAGGDFTAAKAVLPGELPAAMALPLLKDRLSLELPESESLIAEAIAYGELARSASMQGQDELAVESTTALVSVLSSLAPPTADCRRAEAQIESNGNAVKRNLGRALSLTRSDQINSRYNAYRRAMDRIADAAEQRRTLLIQLLARICRRGGTDAVAQVITSNGWLRPELSVDFSCGLIAAAARRSGTPLNALEAPDRSLIVPAAQRQGEQPLAIVGPLVYNGWNDLDARKYASSFTRLQAARVFPGLREAVTNEVIWEAAEKADSVEGVLDAVAGVRNPVWQEDGLEAACRMLARRGLQESVRRWISRQSLAPTAHVAALYGTARGVLESPEAIEAATVQEARNVQ